MRKLIHHITLLSLIFLYSHPMLAQISQGGSPLMNTEDFSAEQVLYLLPPAEPLFVEAAKSFKYNQVKKAIQYAVERNVDLSPEFNGEWLNMESMRVWRVHIISPQAYSLGILFSEYELSDGVRLFIYDEAGEHIKGAFTSQNNKDFGSLFVSHIPGEQLIIEMQVDNDISDFGSLRIGSISHAVEPVFAQKNQDDAGLGLSQDCEIDINCEEGDDWQIIKKSIVQIETPRLLCTGTLVNNTSYDGTPYIITAEHCLNNEIYPQNTVYTFRFENSECGQEDAVLDKSVSGGNLIATGGSPIATDDSLGLDFSLIKLSTQPPHDYDLYYAGWDIRKTNFNSSITLHHPNADAMKISFDFDPMGTPTSVPGDLNDYYVESNFWIRQWDIGTTEGGSSGSPLFNSNKRMIGILSGGLAYCGDSIGYDTETGKVIYELSQNKDDYYSRLYYAWDYFEDEKKQLEMWLDPNGSGQKSIGGLSQKALDIENDNILERKIFVYPNPTSGAINITGPEYNGADLDIEVYNITGRLIHKELQTSEAPLQLNLNHLQTGIYFIRLNGDNYTAASSFLIQK
jgi:lysyl endopeptidase